MARSSSEIKPEIEQREQLFAMLERVVVVLAIVLDRDRFAQIAKLNYDLRIVVVDLNRRDVFDDRFDFVLHVGDEDRVISRQENGPTPE